MHYSFTASPAHPGDSDLTDLGVGTSNIFSPGSYWLRLRDTRTPLDNILELEVPKGHTVGGQGCGFNGPSTVQAASVLPSFHLALGPK